ncbi:MAG: zinc-binding dehydrogenase [Lachnospiraceae bacterium]
MKAWYITGPDRLEMREIPEPALRPGCVVVDVLTAQCSVTEANLVALETDPFGFLERIRAEGAVRLPAHEMVGRVTAVNADSGFKVGDRVSTQAKVTCGVCEACRRGEWRYCQDTLLTGVETDGLMAERVLLRESGLTLVPEVLSDAEAANLQPLGDCVCAVESLTTLKPGCKAAVWGAGCLGMNTMQILKARGAYVMIVDIKEENLKLAKELGADAVINGRETDCVEEVRWLTDGRGADIVIDAAGGNPKKGLAGTAALQQAAKALKPEGECLILAIYGPSVEFPIGIFRDYGKQITMPAFTTTAHMAEAARLIAEKKIQVEPMITHRFHGIEHVPEMLKVTGNKTSVKSLNPAQVVIGE